jgi:hypothetical protein
LILFRFRGFWRASMVASECAFGTRRSQVPRRRRRLSVTGLSAILVMVALAPRLGFAQSTVPEAGTDFLAPTIDGDPANPPRFRKPGTVPRTPNGQPLPTGRFSSTTPAPSRIGATPSFGSPPAFGAGDTGFDSTSNPRRKSKTQVKKPNVLAPPPITTFVPVKPITPVTPAKAPAKPPPKLPEVHPATAAARPGATLPPPALPIPLSNPPPEVHPLVAATRPGAALPVPPPLTPPSLSDGSASSPPPGAPPPNTLPIGTPGPAPRRLLPVTERDPYEPLGIRAGSFLLRPAIEFSTGYDNNPPRLPGGSGSPFFVVAPELTVRSDWSQHALNADIRGSYTEYSNDFSPSLNRPFLDSRIDGRIDVRRDTQINLENRFLVSTDNPGSPNLQAGLAKLPIDTTLGGTAGITHQFNRLEVSAKGTVDRTQYQNSQLTDGESSSNSDRDFNQYAGIFRAGYELTPGLKPFVEVSRDTRVHDQEFDRNDIARNSDGTSVKAGSSFEITRTLTGEFAVGYLKRTYQDPTLPDIKGTIADGSLIWQASALTTAKLLATSTVSESVLQGVSGDFSRDFSLEVDHAFRRWLIGTLKVGYGHDIYVGSDRADNRYFASAGIAYRLTRDMQLRAELRRDWLRSTISTVDYTATAILFGLRLQR